MIFLNGVGWGLYDKGESGAGVLLPDGQICRGNRQPAKREEVAAGFGDPPNLCPGDLVYPRIDHMHPP